MESKFSNAQEDADKASCWSCQQRIDSDSNFCKYCGCDLRTINVKTLKIVAILGGTLLIISSAVGIIGVFNYMHAWWLNYYGYPEMLNLWALIFFPLVFSGGAFAIFRLYWAYSVFSALLGVIASIFLILASYDIGYPERATYGIATLSIGIAAFLLISLSRRIFKKSVFE